MKRREMQDKFESSRLFQKTSKKLSQKIIAFFPAM